VNRPVPPVNRTDFFLFGNRPVHGIINIERDLCNLCCPFGVIGSSHLVADEGEEAGSRRQIGVVQFDERGAAEEAVSWLNGHVFNERICVFSNKKTQKRRFN
jgi:hypothetical protein